MTVREPGRSWPRTIGWELVSVGVVLAGVMAACWPWFVPGRAVFGQRDSLFTVLASHHLQQAMLGQRELRTGPLGWPAPLSVTQADFTAGQGLLSWPVEGVGVEPIAAMGVVAFLGVLLTAYAAHRIARALLGPGPHSWVAGVAAACHPIHLAHAQHANLIHHEWTLAGALLLGWALIERRAWLSFAGGALLMVAPWFGLYMGLHTGLVAVILVLGAALARVGDRRSWLAAGAGLLLGALAFVPVLSWYAQVGFLFEVFADPDLVARWSWDPATTLAPIQRAPLHRWLFALEPQQLVGQSNNPANPGYVAFGLALLGLARWRRRRGPRWAWWVILAVAVSASLLALGPRIVWRGELTELPGPYRLVDWIPGFYGLKDPVRWLGVAWMATGMLAGLGAWNLARWLRRLGPLAPALASLALVALVVAERAEPRWGEPGAMRLDPVYLELDAIEGFGPLWDNALEKAPGKRACGCTNGHAYRAALYHGRPLAGGMAARSPDVSRALRRVMMRWPSPDSVALLRAMGVQVALDHDGTDVRGVEGLECRQVRGHNLCLVAPRPPLPSPEAAGVEGGGAVVGLRWSSAPSGTLELRCGQHGERVSSEVWSVITALRHGQAAAWLDVFFEEPCSEPIQASPTGWEPLYARADDPGWPAEWTGRGPGIAQAFEDIPAPARRQAAPGRKKPRPPARP